jgi:phage recombination protein Bet
MILDYLAAFGLATQLTEPEKLQFIEVAQAFHLNPFKREIHVAVYGEGEYRRLSIITGYEVYLKRAERTGRLDGWKAWVEGEGDAMKALVEIHRKDWSEPFVHEVYWREAVQKKKDGSLTSFWTKQPKFQLKKVAISQGFRLCFPDELGGLPYDASELPDIEALVSAATVSPIPEPKAAEKTASIASKPVTIGTPVSVLSTTKPVAPQPVISPKPETVTIRFLGHPDPYPEEDREALLKRLDAYLDNNAEAFTDKHTDWIMEKARKSQDREGILKMLSYAQKVVKNTSAVAGASV